MKAKTKKTTPRMASLFCGCGGGDIGFSRAGFEVVCSYDNDPSVVDVYNRNLNPVAIVEDLSVNISMDHLKGIDLLLASPPCQGFSTLGKRRFDDPRNLLLSRSALLAVAIKPKLVIIENVSGVVAGEHKKLWDMAHNILRQGGYFTIDYKVNCLDIGMAQKRKRVLLFAFLGKDIEKICLPKKTQSKLSQLLDIQTSVSNHNIDPLPATSMNYKIAKHIKPGQKLCDVRGGDNAVHSWDIPDVFGETSDFEKKVLQKIMYLRRQCRRRENGDADPVTYEVIRKEFGARWTEELERGLILKGYLRKVDNCIDLKRTFNGNYKRIDMNLSSPTVDTKFGCPKYFLHPAEHRGLSVREAARIQSFPDSFVFYGPVSSQYRMIGNAIPPEMAYSVALEIRKILEAL